MYLGFDDPTLLPVAARVPNGSLLDDLRHALDDDFIITLPGMNLEADKVLAVEIELLHFARMQRRCPGAGVDLGLDAVDA